jgi:3-phenylpropionate/cinnamic acid dioxygenase small subunit
MTAASTGAMTAASTDKYPPVQTLEEILAGSLESWYVDDAYYAQMRRDLVEWTAPGRVLEQEDREEYESLILHENWLLDNREFEAWYSLYSEECIYWVPEAKDVKDFARADPQTHVTIACDDRRRLGDRIVWVRTGVAYSQLPPSYTSHASTGFVRIPTDREGEVKIRSSFVIGEFREGHPARTLTGWAGHVFVKEDGMTKIARKIVCLLDADRPQHNMTYLL